MLLVWYEVQHIPRATDVVLGSINLQSRRVVPDPRKRAHVKKQGKRLAQKQPMVGGKQSLLYYC